jgi:hypothetical protein
MMDLEELKQITVEHFVPPFTSWCDVMLEYPMDRKLAFTALLDYLGHQMAGVAAELQLDPNFAEAGEVFAEVAEREFAKMETASLPF